MKGRVWCQCIYLLDVLCGKFCAGLWFHPFIFFVCGCSGFIFLRFVCVFCVLCLFCVLCVLCVLCVFYVSGFGGSAVLRSFLIVCNVCYSEGIAMFGYQVGFGGRLPKKWVLPILFFEGVFGRGNVNLNSLRQCWKRRRWKLTLFGT